TSILREGLRQPPLLDGQPHAGHVADGGSDHEEQLPESHGTASRSTSARGQQPRASTSATRAASMVRLSATTTGAPSLGSHTRTRYLPMRPLSPRVTRHSPTSRGPACYLQQSCATRAPHRAA